MGPKEEAVDSMTENHGAKTKRLQFLTAGRFDKRDAKSIIAPLFGPDHRT